MDLNDFDDDKSPPIFISYQWESQEIVMELKRRLETAGFCCWMDTSLMTGGDSLYGKIYEGISRSKIVIACLTPRYISSKFCIREIILADVLHKPILPVMIEATPWPPPGPIALIVSSLVFVDLFGIGGHGGLGKSADSEARFKEIIAIISRYLINDMVAPLSTKSTSCPHGLCNNNPTFRKDLTRLDPAIASSHLINDNATCNPSNKEDDEEVPKYFESSNEELDVDRITPEEISLEQLPDNNDRVTNCSICCIS